MKILLMDNGSLEPAATFALRRMAQQLGAKLGEVVDPISLLHSSGIPAAQLDHQPAEIFEPALERRLREGENDFLIVPAFFGPSGALTDYLPKRVAALKGKHPPLQLRLAAPLINVSDSTDQRIAAILEERVRETGARLESGSSARSENLPAVILVDHGSPLRAVTAVRNHVAEQLHARLGPAVKNFAAASMERREGPEYAFADPLLEKVLDQPGFNAGNVVIALLFLSPGRHAGPTGDIAKICADARARHPQLHTQLTEPINSHPALIDILAERANAGRSSATL